MFAGAVILGLVKHPSGRHMPNKMDGLSGVAIIIQVAAARHPDTDQASHAC